MGTRKQILKTVILLFCLAHSQRGLSCEQGIINNSKSPYSLLRSVDLNDVRWTGGFWGEKFALVKGVAIPKMWGYFNTEYSQHWTNFRIAARLKKGDWKGTSWHDGDFYKCLESVDLPDGVNIMDVLLPRNIVPRPRFDENLLGGVTVLEGKALFIKDKDWSIQPYGAEPLYKEIGDINPQSFPLRLIPYYAWSNRGVSQMTVWLPVD